MRGEARGGVERGEEMRGVLDLFGACLAFVCECARFRPATSNANEFDMRQMRRSFVWVADDI